jgi:hypothetical protein
MDKVQAMVAVMCEAATAYGAENGMENADIVTALAHTYVIYGFAVRKKDADQQVVSAALVECVSKSCDHMMEVKANAEKA